MYSWDVTGILLLYEGGQDLTTPLVHVKGALGFLHLAAAFLTLLTQLNKCFFKNLEDKIRLRETERERETHLQLRLCLSQLLLLRR